MKGNYILYSLTDFAYKGVDGMKKSKAPKILDKIVDTVLRYKPKKKAKKKHGKR